MACLAELFLHGAETGCKFSWIALLVALEIGAVLFKAVAGQAAAIVHDAHMRLVDEIREAPLFALDRDRGEIDHPRLAPDIVNAVAFCA